MPSGTIALSRNAIAAAAVIAALFGWEMSSQAATIDLHPPDLHPPHAFNINIPAEGLDAALAAFSRQARIHVLTRGAPAAAYSGGVSGRMSASAALAALLRGTGLAYRRVDADTVAIVPAAASTPSASSSLSSDQSPRNLRLAQYQLIDGASDAGVQLADAAEPPTAASTAAELTEVQVTGTRIIRNGYEAPTPVTVVGVSQLQDQAAANYAEVLNEMPEFQGSTTPATSGILDGPNGGSNFLNLRDLSSGSANRTLVLFDGRRMPAEVPTGFVDVNQIPDALISRVDVVTGGASSVYGSDAIAGVVNYVLNTDFNGIQGLLQGGITSEGDGGNDKVQFTFGAPFADGRGHFEASIDQEDQQEVPGDARSWNQQGWYAVQNPNYTKTNGQPQLIWTNEAGLAYGNPGGIISGGPLKGIAFGPGGAVEQWDFGQYITGQYQVGGDWATSTMGGSESIENSLDGRHAFADIRYELTDNATVFFQVNDAYTHSDGQCCYSYFLGSNLTLNANNPYLPASVQSQILANPNAYPNGAFPYGITIRDPSSGFGDINSRYNDIYTLGALGKFQALNSTWNWQLYAQDGLSTVNSWVPYQVMNGNFADAIQAVRVGSYGGDYSAAADPNPLKIANGTITCLSNLLPVGAKGETSNCVPYNLFGTGVNNGGATNYILGGPWERYTYSEGSFGGSLTGEPFNTWAGPVSVAADAEYRKDAVNGTNDPLSNVRGWFSTQQNAYDASDYVYEGALETVIPVLKDAAFAKEIDLNGAARATEYSVSGYVTTWKYGLEWTPVQDVRVRATESADIRAPSLNDLFSAPSTNHNTIPDPEHNNQSYPYYQVTDPNPNLKPEKAHETGVGVVFQPVEVPGLGLSVDYYDIDIKDVIETPSFNYVLDECSAGVTAYCPEVERGANGLLEAITVFPENQAELIAKGVDYEFNYDRRLADFVDSWKGNLGLRLTATETLDLITNTGIPSPSEVLNAVGYGSVPRWGVFGTLTYDLDRWRFAWNERYDSSVQFSNTLIACGSNCPTPIPAGFQTIDYSRVPSYFLADVSVSYRFHEQGSSTAEWFIAVDNVFNRIPPAYPDQVAGATYSLATNPALYDMLGTAFRAGIRFKL
jgi:iron complex outermembrane recepter protein